MAARLDGKVAIVTGAGSRGGGWGNGRASAVLFARHGAQVLLVDRQLEGEGGAIETAALIAAEGGVAEAWASDVTRTADVEGMVAHAAARFGRIDILLNNVGGSSGTGLLALSEQEWDDCFALNVKSVFLTSRAVVPLMRRQGGGAIVNVSSIAGLRATKTSSHPYSASKAALNMLTRTIALEFAAEGIRCNAVVPGMIDTPHVHHAVTAHGLSAAQADAFIEARHRVSPTGQQGSAWDIAHAALFLASAESAYVNGTEIVVDGGLTALMPMPAMREPAADPKP